MDSLEKYNIDLGVIQNLAPNTKRARTELLAPKPVLPTTKDLLAIDGNSNMRGVYVKLLSKNHDDFGEFSL